MERIKSFKELHVYQNAMDAAMIIFGITRSFSPEERYSLVDQVRRSSRSVCANIAEAWRKRRYKAAFISKLSDSESEAAETQAWIDCANRCGYIDDKIRDQLDDAYDKTIAQLVKMIDECDK
jgi:four helix bundle protein